MPKRRSEIEIHSPVIGIKSDIPSDELDSRAQSTGQDFKCYYGVNQKEFGTTLYATSTGAVLGAPINFLFEAAFTGASVLQVLTHTGVSKYTSGTDSFVSDGQTFTGTYADFWAGVMHNGVFFYTNGVDPIQVKQSNSATGTNLASAIAPNTFKAWTLQSIRDHLCLYHVIEDGTEVPNRVQWSKKGVLDLSPGVGDFASGVAGAIDIQDVEGQIRAAAPLAGSVAVYSDRSIHMQYWVGGDEVFRFTKTVSGIGTPSRRGVVAFEGVNYVLSRNNVYAYLGGEDIRPIGDPIKKAMFAEANPASLDMAFLEFDEAEMELLVHIPTTDDNIDTVWVYRVNDESWARLKRPYTAAGRFTRRSGLTWAEVPGSWSDQSSRWLDSLSRADAPIRIYGDQSGRVVKVDPTVHTLSVAGTTTNQSYIYETPDLAGKPSKDEVDGSKAQFVTTEQRWQKWLVQAFGAGQAYASWSTDYGRTFVPFDDSPVTLSATGSVFEFDVDVSNPVFRCQFKHTGTGFCGVEYSKITFLPGEAF